MLGVDTSRSCMQCQCRDGTPLEKPAGSAHLLEGEIPVDPTPDVFEHATWPAVDRRAGEELRHTVSPPGELDQPIEMGLVTEEDEMMRMRMLSDKEIGTHRL